MQQLLRYTSFSARFLGVFFLFVHLSHATLSVANITVEANSDSALKAREEAHAQAKQLAFEKLVKNNPDLLSPSQISSYKNDPVQLDNLIETFSVRSEKLGPKSYRAIIDFKFSTAALNHDASSNQDIDHLKSSTKPLAQNTVAELSVKLDPDPLLIPIYVGEDETYLWQKDNPWYEVVVAHEKKNTFFLPLGDLEDMNAVTPESAIMHTEKDLLQLLVRYEKNHAVIMILKELSAAPFVAEAKLVHVVRQNNGLRIEAVGSFESDPNQEADAFMAELLSREVDRSVVPEMIEEQVAVSSESSTKLSEERKVHLTARYASFQEWQKMQKLLGEMTTQESFLVKNKSVSASAAELIIKTKYPDAELREKLLEKELYFFDEEGRGFLSFEKPEVQEEVESSSQDTAGKIFY